MATLLGILHEAQLSGDWSRMKACRHCEYAFFDRSKNRSAAWCAMSICGNRTKNRAYYRRRRTSDERRGHPRERRGAQEHAARAATAGLLVAAVLPLSSSPGGVALENMVLAAAY